MPHMFISRNPSLDGKMHTINSLLQMSGLSSSSSSSSQHNNHSLGNHHHHNNHHLHHHRAPLLSAGSPSISIESCPESRRSQTQSSDSENSLYSSSPRNTLQKNHNHHHHSIQVCSKQKKSINKNIEVFYLSFWV